MYNLAAYCPIRRKLVSNASKMLARFSALTSRLCTLIGQRLEWSDVYAECRVAQDALWQCHSSLRVHRGKHPVELEALGSDCG